MCVIKKGRTLCRSVKNILVLLIGFFIFLFSLLFVFPRPVEATCNEELTTAACPLWSGNTECPLGYWEDPLDHAYLIYIEDVESVCSISIFESQCGTLGADKIHYRDRGSVKDGYCWFRNRPNGLACGVGADIRGACKNVGCPPGVLPSFLDPNCERMGGARDPNTIGFIVSSLVPYIPVLIGLILLVMFIIGGVKVANSGENEEEKKKGFKYITNAAIGGGILILAIGVVSLFEAIFHLKILYGFGLY